MPNESQGTPGEAAHGKTFVAVALTVQTRPAASIIANAASFLIDGRRSCNSQRSLGSDASAQEAAAAAARARVERLQERAEQGEFLLPALSLCDALDYLIKRGFHIATITEQEVWVIALNDELPCPSTLPDA